MMRLPKSFFKEKLEQAILRRGEEKSPVMIMADFFENGWTEFVEDKGVEEGREDFLRQGLSQPIADIFCPPVPEGNPGGQLEHAKLVYLLRYHSKKGGNGLTSLKDFIIRMKEGQKDIFYTTGESEKAEEERAVGNSPSKTEEEAGFCYQGRIEVGRCDRGGKEEKGREKKFGQQCPHLMSITLKTLGNY
ncbi:hypothetical protein RJ640_013112 [Escallonia rubra]|uniref:Uncharacterized protein n=1 Tax=Escallonia rubra TaxID=112253 RepID=A0AA88RYU2_9ASTE|nr:hypothetical protein RJ640_013112 [Escallonia rubra]